MNDPNLIKVHERLREINEILGNLSEKPIEEVSEKLQKEINSLVEKWNRLTGQK